MNAAKIKKVLEVAKDSKKIEKQRGIHMKKLGKLVLATVVSLSLFACSSQTEKKETNLFTSENVEITSARNTKIKTTIVTPTDKVEGGYPFVIFAHGFQGNRDESGAFSETAEGLAKQGIASIRLDFPGCNESEEDFMAYTLENMQKDVESVLAYAKENMDINEERLGILGYSMGGRVASLYLDDAPIKTAVLWAPAGANGVEAMKAMGSEEEILTTIEEAKESGVGYVKLWGQKIPVAYEFLKQSVEAKPLDVLAAYTGNLLVIRGGKDTTVDASVTDQVVAASVNTKLTSELHIPRATHSLGAGEFGNDPDVQAFVVTSTIHFFTDNL